MKRSKRQKEISKKADFSERFSIDDAVAILQECPPVKFDQSLEVHMKLGIDPAKSDQQVRGTVFLPHGLGQEIIVAVIAKGDKVKEALDAGADYAGFDELIEKIKGGWVDFKVLISTPDMMREVGKLGKILGPRGLMPTPKAGTVTNDIGKAVKEIKSGKVEFRADKMGVINSAVGKLSFKKEQLSENIKTFIGAIAKARPPAAKNYMQSLALSSTMGPGVRILPRELQG